MIYTIYKSVNKKTGKVYIGFDSNWPNRMVVHKSSSKNGVSKFYRAIRKYGWNEFDWSIVYQSLDKNHTLNVMENYFINEHDSYNNGYNSTLGGDGCFGLIISEEHKTKLSSTHKGKKLSLEHIEILREKGKKLIGDKNPMFGKKHTEEHKKKISESSKGISRPMTEEHKKNLNCHINNSTKVSCPHCGKEGQFTNMKRWHFNNCKSVPQS
jgi:group I intron endonuclease